MLQANVSPSLGAVNQAEGGGLGLVIKGTHLYTKTIFQKCKISVLRYPNPPSFFKSHSKTVCVSGGSYNSIWVVFLSLQNGIPL